MAAAAMIEGRQSRKMLWVDATWSKSVDILMTLECLWRSANLRNLSRKENGVGKVSSNWRACKIRSSIKIILDLVTTFYSSGDKSFWSLSMVKVRDCCILVAKKREVTISKGSYSRAMLWNSYARYLSNIPIAMNKVSLFKPFLLPKSMILQTAFYRSLSPIPLFIRCCGSK